MPREIKRFSDAFGRLALSEEVKAVFNGAMVSSIAVNAASGALSVHMEACPGAETADLDRLRRELTLGIPGINTVDIILENAGGKPAEPPALEPRPEKKTAAKTASSMDKTRKTTGYNGYKRKELLRKDIAGIITELDETLSDGDEILAEGVIFKAETMQTRTGRALCTLEITDGTDSIAVKFFLKDSQEYAKNYANVTAVGNGIKVFGKVRFDEYTRDLCLMAEEIAPSSFKLDTRQDLAPAGGKRVEFHLHTQMSQMDAVNSVTDYIKRAAEWGMPAIAVTDHGVVQAFPEAMTAARKYGVKVVYGMEAYLVDDLAAIVKRPGDLTLSHPVVVLDIETTGLDKESCQIIEIAAVKICKGMKTQAFSTFVNPKCPLPQKIVDLTGITDDMLSGAPDIEDVLPKLLDFIGDAVICAHNAAFDTGFLSYAARRLGLTFDCPSICTLELSRLLLPEQKTHSLPALAKHFAIDPGKSHRATDDTRTTAKLFILLRRNLLRKGVNALKDINRLGSGRLDVKKHPYHHAVLLVRNKTGLRSLYEMVSKSHLDYFYKKPRIPKSLLAAKREGLLIGTACEAGEFFQAVLAGVSDDELRETGEFYDYLEIQCHRNNAYLVRDGRVTDEEGLKEINKRIIEIGEALGKPVVAACDVHFMNPADSIYREILMSGEGYKDAEQQAPLYFRTTDEMLAEFDYLSKDKAYEVVVGNTQKIAAMVEKLEPVPSGSYPPNIEGSAETLRQIVDKKVADYYGDTPPEAVSARIAREMEPIVGQGFSSMYVAARKLVEKSLENGYLVGSRGSIGSSLSATMAGITEVNPLPAHYICPACKYADMDPEEARVLRERLPGLSGPDLPDKNCPRCGAVMGKDGHEIMFEIFFGFNSDKEPDIDLNFSGEYQAEAHAYTEELFGKGFVFKAGTIGTLADKTAFGFVQNYLNENNLYKRNAEKNRLVAGLTGIKRTTGQHPGGLIIVPKNEDIHSFCPIQRPANDASAEVTTTHFDYHSALEGRLLKLDILGHDVPTVIKLLQDFTGIDPLTLDLSDSKVLSLFTSTEALGVTEADIGCPTGTLGIPEFGTSFVRQMLLETRPKSFTELVKISGLSHGINVWTNNASDIIKNGVASFTDIIAARDDILIYLMSIGMDNKAAFDIMERVRKGKGVTDDEAALMAAHGVPDWYIESCRRIEYLFPKGHAVAYVMMSVRIGYYKIHHPAAFYAASFSVKTDDFDYETMCKGPEAARNQRKRILALGKDATAKDKNTLNLLELVLEMYARGITFLPMDIYNSRASRFIPMEGGLLPPLGTLDGLGQNAAQNIAAAREEGEFISIQDFKGRTKVTKTVLELIVKNGLLRGLPETNQLSLFTGM